MRAEPRRMAFAPPYARRYSAHGVRPAVRAEVGCIVALTKRELDKGKVMPYIIFRIG
jgi:hypothetical protein